MSFQAFTVKKEITVEGRSQLATDGPIYPVIKKKGHVMELLYSKGSPLLKALFLYIYEETKK